MHFGGGAWQYWPKELRMRDEKALLTWKEELSEEIDYYIFVQCLFFRQ